MTHFSSGRFPPARPWRGQGHCVLPASSPCLRRGWRRQSLAASSKRDPISVSSLRIRVSRRMCLAAIWAGLILLLFPSWPLSPLPGSFLPLRVIAIAVPLQIELVQVDAGAVAFRPGLVVVVESRSWLCPPALLRSLGTARGRCSLCFGEGACPAIWVPASGASGTRGRRGLFPPPRSGR